MYVPGGDSAATIAGEPDAIHFLNEAYKHCKAIAFDEDAIVVLEETAFAKKKKVETKEEGLIIGGNADTLARDFEKAIAQHRFWEREKPRKVPA